MAKSKRDAVERLKASGLSVREIADNLGITTQAVYWHLHSLAKPKGAKRGGTNGSAGRTRKVRG